MRKPFPSLGLIVQARVAAQDDEARTQPALRLQTRGGELNCQAAAHRVANQHNLTVWSSHFDRRNHGVKSSDRRHAEMGAVAMARKIEAYAVHE